MSIRSAAYLGLHYSWQFLSAVYILRKTVAYIVKYLLELSQICYLL